MSFISNDLELDFRPTFVSQHEMFYCFPVLHHALFTLLSHPNLMSPRHRDTKNDVVIFIYVNATYHIVVVELPQAPEDDPQKR